MRTTPYDLGIDRVTLTRRVAATCTGLVPVLVALAWVPLRSRLPNTDVALVLVVVVAGVGFVAGRGAAVIGAVGAGISFDVLHTEPYGLLSITHGRDALTTVLLVMAGATAGMLAAGMRGYRDAAGSDADALALLTDAAGLLAVGGPPQLVVHALAEELERGLGLADCRFAPGPPGDATVVVERDGTLRQPPADVAPGVPAELALPVWAGGAVRGHFVLVLGGGPVPGTAQLRLAVHLADQAGAALGHGPVGPTPGRRRLRLVRSP